MDTTSALKTLSYTTAPAVGAYLTTIGVNHGLLFGLFAMMGIDILTAVVMWLRVDPVRLKSRVLKAGMTEKFASLIPAAVIFVLMLAFDSSTAMILNGYLGLLILAESYSAISNAHCAYTKEIKHEFDAVSTAMKWAKRKLARMVMAAASDEDITDNPDNKQ